MRLKLTGQDDQVELTLSANDLFYLLLCAQHVATGQVADEGVTKRAQQIAPVLEEQIARTYPDHW